MRKIIGVLLLLLTSNVYAGDWVVVRPDTREIISVYHQIAVSGQEEFIYQVPAGKTLIITDVVSQYSVLLYVDGIPIAQIPSGYSFESGITVSSGKNVNVFGSAGRHITITGYLD